MDVNLNIQCMAKWEQEAHADIRSESSGQWGRWVDTFIYINMQQANSPYLKVRD